MGLRNLSVRLRLLLILALLGFGQLLGALSNMLHAWQTYQLAQRMTAADQTAELVLQTAHQVGRLRGLLRFTLSNHSQTNLPFSLDEFQTLDAAVSARLRLLDDQLHDTALSTTVYQLRLRFTELSQQSDFLLTHHNPASLLDNTQVQQHTQNYNQLIRQLGELLTLLAHKTGDDGNSVENLQYGFFTHLQISLLQLRDSAGDEASLIGAALASRTPLSADDIAQLYFLRGRSLQIWSNIQHHLNLHPLGDLADDLLQVERQWINTLIPIQDQIISLVRDDRVYVITLEDYYLPSRSALSSINQLALNSVKLSSQHNQNLQDAARRSILQSITLFSLALLLILVAMLLVDRRFSTPLRQLVLAVNTLRQNNFAKLELPVRREDEFGQLRDAVELLRDSLREHEQMRRSLDEQAKRFQEITSTMGEGLLVLDQLGQITFANPAASRLLGWSEQELLGRNAHYLIHHTRADGVAYQVEDCDVLKALFSGQAYRSQEETYWRRDGTPLPVSVVASPILRQNNLQGVVLAFQDISELKHERDWLKRLNLAIEYSPLGVLVTDAHSRIIYANQRMSELTGYSIKELIGQRPLLFRSGQTAPDTYKHLWSNIRAGQPWSGELLNRRKNGTLYWAHISIAPVGERDKKEQDYVCITTDITERKQLQQLLTELSYKDALTGVANRRYFDEQFRHEWARAQRSLSHLAVIMIDIDYFKLYNDHFGHQEGDSCLHQVAQTLRHALARSTDLIARYGGEEFVCLLPDTPLDGARLVAEQMRRYIAKKAIHHPQSNIATHVTISLGVAACTPDLNSQPEQLLACADSALYQAKREGRNRTVAQALVINTDYIDHVSTGAS